MLSLVVVIFALLMTIASSMPPIGVVANVRGKKYDVTAETVEQFMKQVETMTGIESNLQNVLFKGKVLNPSDKFDELGIAAGEVLNVVKGRKVAKVSSPEEVNSFGKDPQQPGELDGQMPNFSPEDMQKAQETMDGLLDSNFIEEYFTNEEKLEKSRLQLLENIDKYEKMMPGFKDQALEIASDPQKWKEAMLAAKEQMLKLRDKRRSQKNPGGFSLK